MQKFTVLGVAMLFGAAAAPLPVFAATGDASEAPPSVLAFDQAPRDGSITVDYAHLPNQGYIAVYGADSSGKPGGKPLGYTRLGPGEHRQLKISLAEKPTAGDRLWLSMYKDGDNDTSFKPGIGDKPVWSKSDLPAENMIVVR